MIQHTQQALSAQKPARNDERGAILVITLVLVLVITLAVLALMYLTRNNVLISSNMAVQSAAQEAADQGFSAANTSLQILPNWPEITSPGTWYQPLPVIGGTITRPTVPPASFWSSCGTKCASIPVKYGSFDFNVQYTMYPAGALATQVGGNEQNQTGTGPGVQSIRYYVVYVHTSRTNGGGLGVTVQAILRKVQ
ncbi:conserved protein of unknown function [Acidithiobacillus ferrivorans]|uniref:Type 4 fimbrial biogenesis protein PilX N-terminal domain-containing protein n=1 Tax=Acidithiobacillus ferrivorans TaxID=160808 RepID=A0A060URD2_9PROT|nr:PilX N-terminal domain-containing pilus assembly protein [Acidithiobacillus ferrivorans]OCB01904.1 hypothetical protein BBC27_01475 [Acidithiobacillus ferrivorans]CDQ09114.1 conserved hypothetical protein [Acidithiobacillus ferrivorans]SMH64011.1 conserved protein of unknown function [Acidithiobacillus ferrivorans]